eukprot:7274209-Karenia_brevis.AAC.1
MEPVVVMPHNLYVALSFGFVKYYPDKDVAAVIGYDERCAPHLTQSGEAGCPLHLGGIRC